LFAFSRSAKPLSRSFSAALHPLVVHHHLRRGTKKASSTLHSTPHPPLSPPPRPIPLLVMDEIKSASNSLLSSYSKGKGVAPPMPAPTATHTRLSSHACLHECNFLLTKCHISTYISVVFDNIIPSTSPSPQWTTNDTPKQIHQSP